MKLAIVLLSVIGFSAAATLTRAFDGPSEVAENVYMTYSPNSSLSVYFPLRDFQQLAQNPVFNTTRPLAIYFHGWMKSTMSQDVLIIREAYEDDHLNPLYNVITVDWNYYAPQDGDVNFVIPQLKVIGETFAQYLLDFVGRGYSMDKVELVGHSLGGQLAGKIGRSVRKISNNKIVVPKIYALDPIAAHFESNLFMGFESLSRNDATYVQVIHTNGGILGMQRESGTVDFYPNGGVRQSGCESDPLSENICDHNRAWELFQNSIVKPDSFPAIKCTSYDDFLSQLDSKINNNCDKNDIAYMGFDSDTTKTGKYYFETNRDMFSLSRGMDGIFPQVIPPPRPLIINRTRSD